MHTGWEFYCSRTPSLCASISIADSTLKVGNTLQHSIGCGFKSTSDRTHSSRVLWMGGLETAALCVDSSSKPMPLGNSYAQVAANRLVQNGWRRNCGWKTKKVKILPTFVSQTLRQLSLRVVRPVSFLGEQKSRNGPNLKLFHCLLLQHGVTLNTPGDWRVSFGRVNPSVVILRARGALPIRKQAGFWCVGI